MITRAEAKREEAMDRLWEEFLEDARKRNPDLDTNMEESPLYEQAVRDDFLDNYLKGEDFGDFY